MHPIAEKEKGGEKTGEPAQPFQEPDQKSDPCSREAYSNDQEVRSSHNSREGEEMGEEPTGETAPLLADRDGPFSWRGEGRSTVKAAPVPGPGRKPALRAFSGEVNVNRMLGFREVVFHTLREAPSSGGNPEVP
ncbi:MAG: hypothetical protein HYY65_09990 [Candidatus Tectomicrobia bacterium]|uniref:Uncharacterized protein n=1 Tax=Tectimicrobiota bacterium TaxID=2528274 RepID=A0A932M1C0_UNCTE|nr:hypothetical protein [Candidatus Tectomicrobia bacterium]